MSHVIGIDLGTTNSVAAVWQGAQSELIPNSLGRFLTPSCVSVDESGEILVGQAALERLSTHPDRTAASFKRYMGTDRELRLAGRAFRPEELSALVLRSLKDDAQVWLKADVSDAVIAVPAYFNDAQRKATRIAGELAGLNVLRLVNEPTAAALAYSVHEYKDERKFLIFDLGGGTFDVSVLDFFEGMMEVRASTGDNFLGGDDFTQALCQMACQRMGLTMDDLSPIERQRLWRKAELAKQGAGKSEAGLSRITLRVRDEDRDIQWTETEAERVFEPLLNKLRQPVERALRDSKIPVDELDEVILVGGATRLGLVRRLVSRMFGKFPTAHLNPDEVVALGAAVQAGLVTRDAGLEEIVMTDVAPYTLGIETAMQADENTHTYGHYLPIIDRNTVIPASRTRRVYTLKEGQRQLRLDVYQGEARLVRNNVYLGEILLDVPAMPQGEAGADVRFTYDVSGVLEVQATAFPQGQTRSLIIEKNPGVLSQAEIADRLAALESLKIHPRDQAENRALMARAERLYEESLGGIRDDLAARIARFESLLETQDPNVIKRARQELKWALDGVEGHA